MKVMGNVQDPKFLLDAVKNFHRLKESVLYCYKQGTMTSLKTIQETFVSTQFMFAIKKKTCNYTLKLVLKIVSYPLPLPLRKHCPIRNRFLKGSENVQLRI